MAKKPKGIKKKARIHNGITGEEWKEDVEVVLEGRHVLSRHGTFFRQNGVYRKYFDPNTTLEII